MAKFWEPPYTTQHRPFRELDHRHRGHGLGREFFAAVLADARERSGKRYLIWTVHPQNVSMTALSKSLVADKKEFGIEADSGYLIFIDP
jgi:GNAT superfamily N-acetyltransferase